MLKTKNFLELDLLQKNVGYNIRKLCYKKDISLLYLSEQVSISYEYMRHIVSKNGKKKLSFYSIYKIAKVLETTIDELCEETEKL